MQRFDFSISEDVVVNVMSLRQVFWIVITNPDLIVGILPDQHFGASRW